MPNQLAYRSGYRLMTSSSAHPQRLHQAELVRLVGVLGLEQRGEPRPELRHSVPGHLERAAEEGQVTSQRTSPPSQA